MTLILKLDMLDLYFVAMLWKGYTCKEICDVLGYSYPWATQRKHKITGILGDIFDYNGNSLVLSEDGNDYGELFYKLIQPLSDNFREPKVTRKQGSWYNPVDHQ